MKKLIPILLCALVIGLGGYKYYKYQHPDPVEIMPVQVVSNNHTSTTPTTAAITGSSVNIQLDPVMNGTYKGVIEVGASGFNAFVVSIDKDKNWELVSKEFGESLAWEGFANTSDIYAQTKKYISSLANKGCAGRNIQFVVSSGAMKVKNIDMVMKAIEEKGYIINRVTADQEGKFALKALLPKGYRNNSFTVDIGSGNTKISWYEGTNLKTVECPGAKYYAIGKTDAQVYTEVATACNQVPVAMRSNCFMIGGTPFTLAKESRNGNERFTALKNPDEYSAGDDVKKKSGINIYRAIYETCKSNSYIFDWDANFTIGFLLSMN
jgi:hypothetical protein